jgi:protein-S-isoprenylcysteine O-methyltransferase Ste14
VATSFALILDILESNHQFPISDKLASFKFSDAIWRRTASDSNYTAFVPTAVILPIILMNKQQETNTKHRSASRIGFISFRMRVILVGIFNLWLFYLGGYAIVYPLRLWAEKKRGSPFEDPELTSQRRVMIPAAIWMLSGLVISLFVPIDLGLLFYPGLVIAAIGLVLVAMVFHSFSKQPGLATSGIQRYSRNPNYIGWTTYFLGLTLIGWSESIWSIAFTLYLIYTALYLHSNVLQEEVFLANKYGDSYRDYLKRTPRYFGRRKESAQKLESEVEES